MFHFQISTFHLPPSALRRHSTPVLLFFISALVATGCWSEVEYKPPAKPASETPTVETPPAAEPTAISPAETPAPNGEPIAETPVETPAAETLPPVSATPETQITSDELFGEVVAETLDSPTTVAPPLDDTAATPPAAEQTATPAETTVTTDELFGEVVPPTTDPPKDTTPPPSDAAPIPPAAESNTEGLLPHEVPSTPSTTPTTESTTGDRYAETPQPETFPEPSTETISESPAATVVGDRYATEPDATPPSEAPPVAESAATTAKPEAPTSSNESLTPPFAWDQPAEPTPSAAETKPIAESVAPIVAEPTPPAEETAPLTVEPVVAAPPPSPEVSFNEHPAATPATAPHPSNTRLQAWLLGSKWSLMLLKEHTVGLKDEDSRLLKECEELAAMLKVKLPNTQFTSASKPTAAVLESLVFAARELGSSIGKEDGAQEMALFEVAVKSNLLLVAAEPRPDLVPVIMRSVTAAAKRAELSDELIQQFADALAKPPKPVQFDGGIQEFHRNVESHLRTLP